MPLSSPRSALGFVREPEAARNPGWVGKSLSGSPGGAADGPDHQLGGGVETDTPMRGALWPRNGVWIRPNDRRPLGPTRLRKRASNSLDGFAGAFVSQTSTLSTPSESLVEIGRSYNVSNLTIARLQDVTFF